MFKIWRLALVGKWLEKLLCIEVTFCLAINQGNILSRRKKKVSGLKVLGER